MRDVLLQLAMCAAGRTASYDSSGGGDPDYVLVDEHGRAKLGAGDAPHLHYAAEWDAASDDERRAAVLDEAKKTLDSIRRSQADPTAIEPKDARDRRIVKEGEGWPAREVAISMRCGIRDVWRAREAAGRDVEFGELKRNGRELTREELNAEILRLHRKHMSGREIADALGIARSSVRYVLARPPKL
jgi:predicted XRE-type DNA-binding protein